MTSIGSWQPDTATVVDETLVTRLLRAASQLDQDDLGLTADEIVRHAGLMRQPSAVWEAAVKDLGDGEIESLIRFFTLAEARLPNWEAGAQSPVIPLAAVLRQRGAWPPALSRWIRAESRNRFLPWGSLADRLR